MSVFLTQDTRTQGVGSASQLDRLSRDHVAYQWIGGDASLDYHSLPDLRTSHVTMLDDLLSRSIAVPQAEGLIDLEQVAPDGMRVRTSAGAASFRYWAVLKEALVQALVEALRTETERNPTAD